jgi:hypothetical protein
LLRAVSVSPIGSHVLAREPQAGISPAQEIDLVAGEIGTSEEQIGNRFQRVEGKSNAQGSIGK